MTELVSRTTGRTPLPSSPYFQVPDPTSRLLGPQKLIPEIVATDASHGFESGGGFSYYFPRPKYQDAVVGAYVKSLGDECKGLYNPNGRGYPDIAAQGYHFATIWNGTLVPLDGTSASTRAAAAVIALVNDALIAAGKPPLGFLNPWLYAGGYKAFTDVTNGSSIRCGKDGFPAVNRWDAVTGWGTPVSLKTFLCRCCGGIRVVLTIVIVFPEYQGRASWCGGENY
jgi:tripeptidyl-peptidase-1